MAGKCKSASFTCGVLYVDIKKYVQCSTISLSPVLKVLPNEKRGGLEVAAFDRSPIKLFSLKFSNKSVQAPSSERQKTAPQTLFLSFAN
jgi:hypothetical protein